MPQPRTVNYIEDDAVYVEEEKQYKMNFSPEEIERRKNNKGRPSKSTGIHQAYVQACARTNAALKKKKMDIVKQETENLNQILDTVTKVKDVVIPIDEPGNMVNIYDDFSPRKYVIKSLRNQFDRDEVMDTLKSRYKMTDEQAKAMIKGCRQYLNKEYEKFCNNVAQTNIEMVQNILQDAIQRGDKKTSLECIDMLNKMCGIYQKANTMEVISKDMDIKISFGE